MLTSFPIIRSSLSLDAQLEVDVDSAAAEIIDQTMRILVVGAGAVGGYFGARLAEAGRDVTFLVRPKHAERIKDAGIRIVSPHGDLTVHPNVVT